MTDQKIVKVEFQVRWRKGDEPEEPYIGKNEKDARKKALAVSKDKTFHSVQMGKVEFLEDGTTQVPDIWQYEDGKETGHQQRVSPAKEEAEASSSSEHTVKLDEIDPELGQKVKKAKADAKAKDQPQAASEAPATEENTDMATTANAKKVTTKKAPAKAPAKKAAKASPVASKQPKAKAAGESVRVTGKAALGGKKPTRETLRDAFATRSGSIKEKLIDVFFDNFGKTIPLSQLIKKAYGVAVTDEKKSALSLAINGIKQTMEKEKLPFELAKEKNEKSGETCVGLFDK